MIKRKILWWMLMCLLLIAAVWLISNNEGYVLMVRSPYRIQFSFNFFLALWLLSFFALHYGLRLLHFVRRLPSNRRAKREMLRLTASNAALIESLQAYSNGDTANAKKSAELAQAVLHHPTLSQVLQTLETQKQSSANQ